MSSFPQKKFFTWDIHYACNYYCNYCYFRGKWKKLKKKNVYPGVEKWDKVWNSIFDRHGSCYIHITGGEPFAYPKMIDLCALLVDKHRIGFDTNLSLNVDEFISKVKFPERVSFSASFHPGFSDLNEFLDKLKRLHCAGSITEGVNCVAYPPILDDLNKYRKEAAKKGFELTILPFRGEYEGKEYPVSYTPRQRAGIWGESVSKEDGVSGIPSGGVNSSDTKGNEMEPSKEMLKWYSGDRDGREGKLCRMGECYTKVHPDGTAHRCCMTWENWGMIGNLLDGSFSFYEEPKPCPYAKCACSAAMILGEESRWRRHWNNRMGLGTDNE